ncbi:MAG: sulfite exporter TauE/SafE family protein [Myxococcota bacterium]
MVVATSAAAALAALVGSPHCIGMCGPLACAAGPKAANQVAYHTGRIGTYATLGALAGALGPRTFLPEGLATAAAALLLLGFAASLAGWLPEPRALPGLVRLGARLAQTPTLASRFAFGVINGLLPCGLVYATLAVPMAGADPTAGALAMATFGLFTVPALASAAFGLRLVLNRTPRVRVLLAGIVLVSGLATLGLRDGWFVGEAPADAPLCHVPH